MDKDGFVKQEVVDIPFEDTYFAQLDDLKTIDDDLVLSYITHECICCRKSIERYSLDKHMQSVHLVQVFKEGLKVCICSYWDPK